MKQNRDVKAYHHGELIESLLKAALELIERRAHPEFTIRELAATIGVSHPAVYRHFKSKQEIQVAIAARGYAMLSDRFQKLKKENVKELLVAQATSYVEFAVENPGFFRSMFHPHLNISLEFPELKDAADMALKHLRDAISRLFENQAQNKSLEKAINQVTAIFWSNVHGIASLSVDDLIASPLNLKHIGPSALAKLQAQTFLCGLDLGDYLSGDSR